MILLLLMLFKTILLFAVAGTALVCLRRAPASARHLVCLLTLAALLALPLFSLTLPGWHLAALSTSDTLPPPVLTSQEVPPAPNNGGAGKEPTPQRVATLPRGKGKEPVAKLSSSSPLGRTPSEAGRWVPWSLFCICLYALGVLLACLRPLLGLWGIARLRRLCTAVTDSATLALSADCAASFPLRQPPQICRAAVCVPMTWGWRRPVLLLPDASTGWPQDRLRSVLLHEMAHIQRRDWAGHRLADIACALYWFHPCVWLVARRLRSESEAACDDLVLACGVPAPDYARHLLDIAQALPPTFRPSQSTAIAMAQTPHIKRRILVILDKTQNRRTVTRRALLAALVPTAALLPALAALHPTSSVQAASSSSKSTQPLMLSAANAQTSGRVVLAGVTNADKPSNSWWSAAGALLPRPVYDMKVSPSHFHGMSGTRDVSFALRFPAAAQDVSVDYKLIQSSSASSPGRWTTKMQNNAGRRMSQIFARTGGAYVITGSFPPTLKKTSLQVGIAGGIWRTGAVQPSNPGYSASQATEAGIFIFSPVTSLGRNNSSITLTTGQPKQDMRVIVMDTQSHVLLPSSVDDNSESGLDQIILHFALPITRIKEFRVETRPFQWTEFKDVALQPSKAIIFSDAGLEEAIERLHRIYGLIGVYRHTHGGAFPPTNPPGLLADMAAHPLAYSLPDLRAGNGAQAAHFFTAPGSDLTIYLLKNKRPDGTLVGTAKRAWTRDVFASLGNYAGHFPRTSGFYLVLWDDGTVAEIPADEALSVPAYDLIGPTDPKTTEEAARQGVMQTAYPGQAGLPKS